MSHEVNFQPSCPEQTTLQLVEKVDDRSVSEESDREEQWKDIYQNLSPVFKRYLGIISEHKTPVQTSGAANETRLSLWKICMKRVRGTVRLFGLLNRRGSML